MRAVAHGWKKPGGGGPSVSVAKEFAEADKAKGTHMKKGGHMSKAMKPRLPAALAAQSAPPPNAEAGPVTEGQPGGMPGMKRGGSTKKLSAGGETVKGEQGPVRKWKEPGEEKDAHGKEVAMKKGGMHSRGGGIARKGYASGGHVRKVDGIAERGRTRGRFV
jgi:hypothetical protein